MAPSIHMVRVRSADDRSPRPVGLGARHELALAGRVVLKHHAATEAVALAEPVPVGLIEGERVAAAGDRAMGAERLAAQIDDRAVVGGNTRLGEAPLNGVPPSGSVIDSAPLS